MQIIDNKDKNRFEAVVEGHTAIVEYSLKQGVVAITHTEVPKELAGQGVGSKMTEAVLKQIKDRGLKVNPLCPFTEKYIGKHPEWNDIVEK